jgi:hypothetical protein
MNAKYWFVVSRIAVHTVFVNNGTAHCAQITREEGIDVDIGWFR